MKMLATKVFAVCLLVALREGEVFGKDEEESGETAFKQALESEVGPGNGERSNDSCCEASGQIELKFKAFGKDFFATIRQENTIFASDAEVMIHGDDGMTAQSLPIEKHYGGHLEGLVNSTLVMGRFTRGVFDGVICTDEDDYFVEPADRYFPNNPDFNAVVYKAGDSLWPYPENAIPTMVNFTSKTRRAVNSEDDFFPSAVRLQCSVKVVMSDAGRDHSAAVSEVQYYVAATDSIFRATDFDGDGRANDLGFVISGVEMFESGGPANLTAVDFGRACIGLLLTRSGRPDDDDDDGSCRRLSSAGARICSSANVAAVSLLSPDGTPRPHSTVAARVAHQFGHLFGSPDDGDDDDDDDPRCQNERFVMNPRTLTAAGSRRGFSECSRRSVGQFLRTPSAMRCLTARDAAGTPMAEVSDNELPDAWSEQLAAKGSKTVKRKKVAKGATAKKKENGTMADGVATTAAKTEKPSTAKATTILPEPTTTTATTEPPLLRPEEPKAPQNASAGQIEVRRGNVSVARDAASTVESPWQAMAATMVTFVAVGFGLSG